MSTAVQAPRTTTASHDPRPAPPRRRVLAGLARIEAGRVARHPGVLLGIVAGLGVLPTVGTANALAGTELLVLGIMSFLIGFLNVDRARRDDTIELLEALPVPLSVGNLGWHLFFLISVCAATSAAALLRDSRAPVWWLLLAAGLAGLALGAALQ